MGAAKADAIRRLWNGFYSKNLNTTDAAALQLAIWRIEYDWDQNNHTAAALTALKNFDGMNGQGNFLTNGGTHGGAAAITEAQTLLENVFNRIAGYDIAAANVVALTS